MRFRSKHELISYLTNMRLGWKWLAMTNALAYDATVMVTIVKSFRELAPDEFLTFV